MGDKLTSPARLINMTDGKQNERIVLKIIGLIPCLLYLWIPLVSPAKNTSHTSLV